MEPTTETTETTYTLMGVGIIAFVAAAIAFVGGFFFGGSAREKKLKASAPAPAPASKPAGETVAA